jgi:hypothetical protein
MSIAVQQRAETFGYGTDEWAVPALRLVFASPRTYAPLAAAWDTRFPGSRAALDRLTALGFLVHQQALVLDTASAEFADSTSRSVDRYVLSAAGRRLLSAAREDERTLNDHYPRLTPVNLRCLLTLLGSFELSGSHAKVGLSAKTAIARSGFSERTGRWWVKRLTEAKILRQLPQRVADVRPVIPAHWRPTVALRQQLRFLVKEGIAPAAIAVEFHLARSRTLPDIDPARLGVSGATDWDHDVQAQLVLAELLRSPSLEPRGVFLIEPRLDLPVTAHSPGSFRRDADGASSYIPDAELRERDDQGLLRSVLEYERFQSRRDAWSHVEKFLGRLHLDALPGERGVLRFVLDSDSRVRSYVSLIEALADYFAEHPERLPRNPVLLAVSSLPRLRRAKDPLAAANWYRIALPGGSDTEVQPVLHVAEDSPYNRYFAR